MAQNYFYPPSGGGGSSSNASVSANGAAIPTSSTLVAGENPSGIQQPLQTNAAGDLFVVQAAGATDSVNLTEVGGAAVSLGQKTSAVSIPVVIASDDTVAISAASLPLPTGASTSALQTSGNSSLTSILANQTNGTQVTSATVTSSVLPTGAATSANQTNGTQITKISQLPQDFGSLQSFVITTQDLATTQATQANGQVVYTGTATPASFGAISFNSDQSVEVEVQGIWTGTLQFEITGNNAAWVAQPLRQVGILSGSSQYVTTVTSNFIGTLNVSAESQFRVRAIAPITGSVTIRTVSSTNLSTIYLGAPIEISSTSSLPLPSGAATSANQTSQITQETTTATNTTSILANQTNGTQKSQVSTPTPLTIHNAALTVGLTPVRLTVSGSAPASTRVTLVVTPDPAVAANFYIGSSTVAVGTGPKIVSFIANSDAGDYWIISDTAGQLVEIMEQY